MMAMPFLDIQKRFGLNIDRWWTIQSAEQPYKIAPRCRAFEKEWIECAHGIGATRAEKECKIEYDDFIECLLRQKTGSQRRAQQKKTRELKKASHMDMREECSMQRKQQVQRSLSRLEGARGKLRDEVAAGGLVSHDETCECHQEAAG
uniref:NADH dehydrogenase [ubiquinone] iron-sulfur protein 5 n=1 Tax=Papio anubis TaxID=9555 RepID=A0A8I5NDW7_PAPAN